MTVPFSRWMRASDSPEQPGAVRPQALDAGGFSGAPGVGLTPVVRAAGWAGAQPILPKLFGPPGCAL